LPGPEYHAKLHARGIKAAREIERYGRVRSLDAEYGPPSPPFADLRNPAPDPFCDAGGLSVGAPSANGNKR
jgi:hypothetical protein